MNALKLKLVSIAFLLAGSFPLLNAQGLSAKPYGQTEPTARQTETTTSAKYCGPMCQDKRDINRDLASIAAQQDKVKALQQQCTDERKAGIKGTDTRSDLIKARAELNMDKEYLRADKTALLDQHDAIIKSRCDAVKTERAALRTSQKKLDADLAKGNATASWHAQQVVSKKNDLKQREQAVKQARIDRNNDLLAINKKIDKVNGQPAARLQFENSYARTINMAMK